MEYIYIPIWLATGSESLERCEDEATPLTLALCVILWLAGLYGVLLLATLVEATGGLGPACS